MWEYTQLSANNGGILRLLRGCDPWLDRRPAKLDDIGAAQIILFEQSGFRNHHRRLRPVRHVETAEQGAHADLDRIDRRAFLARDFLVRQAEREMVEKAPLRRAEPSAHDADALVGRG